MGLAPDIRKRIAELEEATKDYDGLNFQIALNYGGQDEIVRAVRKVMADTQKGLQPEDMTIEKFADYLDTKGIPEPDLMIRTSGRTEDFQFPDLAACLYGALFYTGSMACFRQKRNWRKQLQPTISGIAGLGL